MELSQRTPAALLAVAAGLLVAVVGAYVMVDALSMRWASHGSESRDGWSWMSIGDLWIVVAGPAFVAMAAALVAAPPNTTLTLSITVASVVLLVLTICGILFVWFLTSLSGWDFDEPAWTVGPGLVRSIVGTAIATSGVALLLSMRRPSAWPEPERAPVRTATH